MRGDANPASDPARALTRPARRASAVAVAALIALAATGGAASPLLPPLAALLILFVRYAPGTWAAAAPLGSAAALLVMAALAGDVDFRDVVVAFLVAAAAYPGWLWRREARRSARRLEKLDDILSQAGRNDSAQAPAAAQVPGA